MLTTPWATITIVWGCLLKRSEFNPNSPDAHTNLGLAYVGLGNKEAATQEYNIVKSMDPILAKQLLKAIASY
ncbi:MAG: hypothetical protein JWM21_4863 [Acidobacteria bacterium]|nr:hypothetical protein [Acidobacteriota bacterium]